MRKILAEINDRLYSSLALGPCFGSLLLTACILFTSTESAVSSSS